MPTETLQKPKTATVDTKTDALVAHRLRQARQINGMTEIGLASATGMGAVQICAFMSGKASPTISQLATLARALRMDLGFFLDGLDQLMPIFPAALAQANARTLEAAAMLAAMPDNQREAIITVIEKANS